MIMKKYNVYYSIQKGNSKPITNRYYWVDATSEQDAKDKANVRGKEWQPKGYSFKVDYAEVSNWFAI
jgi:hypothetical protein